MDTNIPYMFSVSNVSKILDKIQHAAEPPTFNLDFLKDLGFSSSSDRPFVKVLTYLGFLDGSRKPLAPYREFLDGTKAKKVLAARMRAAFDDLFLTDKNAHTKSAEELKGWFKSKTGVSESVAQKLASTFKAFATYADFSSPTESTTPPPASPPADPPTNGSERKRSESGLSFVYRIEIHLPDTPNVETYRAIFKALREELA